MKFLEDLEAERAAAQAAYLDLVATDTYTESQRKAACDAHRAARDALTAAIVEGANPCTCGAQPHGILQPPPRAGYPNTIEIGCLACPNTRAVGFTREQAVERWNERKFLAPKAQGGGLIHGNI